MARLKASHPGHWKNGTCMVAGASSGIRTHIGSLEGCGPALGRHSREHGEDGNEGGAAASRTLVHLLARQGSDPSDGPMQQAGVESDHGPRIWNPLGRHDLRPARLSAVGAAGIEPAGACSQSTWPTLSLDSEMDRSSASGWNRTNTSGASDRRFHQASFRCLGAPARNRTAFWVAYEATAPPWSGRGPRGSAPRIRTWISSVNGRAHYRCARAE